MECREQRGGVWEDAIRRGESRTAIPPGIDGDHRKAIVDASEKKNISDSVTKTKVRPRREGRFKCKEARSCSTKLESERQEKGRRANVQSFYFKGTDFFPVRIATRLLKRR